MSKAKVQEALKKKILDVLAKHGAGSVSRKELARMVGEHPSSRDFTSAVDSLVGEEALFRSGGSGAGHRFYLPPSETALPAAAEA